MNTSLAMSSFSIVGQFVALGPVVQLSASFAFPQIHDRALSKPNTQTKTPNKKLKPNKYKQLKRDSLRGNVKGTLERPRLSVYRSNEHIYAQIIDDTNSKTL